MIGGPPQTQISIVCSREQAEHGFATITTTVLTELFHCADSGRITPRSSDDIGKKAQAVNGDRDGYEN